MTAAETPSAGGAGCRLVREAIDPAALLGAVADASAGGNVLFLGTTRRETGGAVTAALDYEAHEALALRLLEELRREAITRFGLRGCAVIHRLGRVAAGVASIGIATSAPHRREAFAAAEWLLERIKAVVPVWKCEEGDDGGRAWVHPGDMRHAPETVRDGGEAVDG